MKQSKPRVQSNTYLTKRTIEKKQEDIEIATRPEITDYSDLTQIADLLDWHERRAELLFKRLEEKDVKMEKLRAIIFQQAAKNSILQRRRVPFKIDASQGEVMQALLLAKHGMRLKDYEWPEFMFKASFLFDIKAKFAWYELRMLVFAYTCDFFKETQLFKVSKFKKQYHYKYLKKLIEEGYMVTIMHTRPPMMSITPKGRALVDSWIKQLKAQKFKVIKKEINENIISQTAGIPVQLEREETISVFKRSGN